MSDRTVRVELDLPRDLLGALDVPEHELGSRLTKLIALELFREQQISAGKAAELLGISKSEFIHQLDQHGIDYFTESPAEMKEQIRAMREKLDDSPS